VNGWLEAWTGLLLDDPVYLGLLGLLPLAWLSGRRRGRAALRFAPAAFLAAPTPLRSARIRLLWLLPVVELLAVGLAVFALARPVERIELPREAVGIDVLLCVDVSSSMAARDLDPQRSRLEVAKAAAAKFVAGRGDDRIGLVRFARYPDLACPPTLDHEALQAFLRGVEQVTAEGPEDQTGIGLAVARAAQALRSAAPDASRVLILLTDGEENVATEDRPGEIGPALAARMCEELGIRVYAIAVGLGKPGPDGAPTPLDTRAVEDLVEVTGGQFFVARDARAVDEVYAAIDELEATPVAEPRYELRDRFLPFALLAGLLLVIAGVARLRGLEVLP
jgi:Ca-activated chloride channel family protein